MDETEYLTSSPNNARRLAEAIGQLDAGFGAERRLLEAVVSGPSAQRSAGVPKRNPRSPSGAL